VSKTVLRGKKVRVGRADRPKGKQEGFCRFRILSGVPNLQVQKANPVVNWRRRSWLKQSAQAIYTGKEELFRNARRVEALGGAHRVLAKRLSIRFGLRISFGEVVFCCRGPHVCWSAATIAASSAPGYSMRFVACRVILGSKGSRAGLGFKTRDLDLNLLSPLSSRRTMDAHEAQDDAAVTAGDHARTRGPHPTSRARRPAAFLVGVDHRGPKLAGLDRKRSSRDVLLIPK
jgi:hypothetical protein